MKKSPEQVNYKILFLFLYNECLQVKKRLEAIPEESLNTKIWQVEKIFSYTLELTEELWGSTLTSLSEKLCFRWNVRSEKRSRNSQQEMDAVTALVNHYDVAVETLLEQWPEYEPLKPMEHRSCQKEKETG